MEDKKIEENDVVTSGNTTDETERREPAVTKSNKKRSITTYVVSGLVILIIALGIVFLLEKQERINTGLFTNIIAEMKAKTPVAKVNGVVIPTSDFESGVKQLVEMAKLQGMDSTSEEALAGFKTEALETLINGELLRQSALEKGKTATSEEVDEKFNQISEDIGGKEVLEKRMMDFGITEENLRHDIESDILIKGLFDSEIGLKEAIEVTDEEVTSLYNEANVNSDLPPLDEIRDKVVEQIRMDKYQQKITIYLEDLKGKAEIEKLI